MTSAAGPTSLVVMGVSGSGKTTVGQAVARRLGWRFAEGDDFHSDANRSKMHAGVPLDDEDRWPWLRSIAAWIGDREAAGESAVLTCSALRRSYRDLLRDGHPSPFFVEVEVPVAVLRERLEHRRGHFMPASLLQSQLDALEGLGPDEPGTVVSGEGSAEDTVEHVLAVLRARA